MKKKQLSERIPKKIFSFYSGSIRFTTRKSKSIFLKFVSEMEWSKFHPI